MSKQRDIALGMVVTKWSSDQITPGIKILRDMGKLDLVPGESVAAISPVDGSILGKVTRTKPTPKAAVVDESELFAYVQENDPEQLSDVDWVSGSNADVLAALKQSHPHLVSQKVCVSTHHLTYLLKKAEGDKTFRPPGIEVTQSAGTVNIYPAKDMAEAFEAVIKSGTVALDGTIRPALEGGSE